MSECTIRRLQTKHELAGRERRPFTSPLPQKGRTLLEGETGPNLGPGAPFSSYRVFLHCPLCLKETLSTEEARLLTNLIHRNLLEEAQIFLGIRNLRLFMLEPTKTEIAQLLSHRIVLGAICQSHRQVSFERIEQAVVLASRYGQLARETL